MGQKTTWIVGANKECDIVIDEDTISGTHCQLTLENSVYSIEDLNSTNGVYVNGKQIFEITFVTEHDEIKLGKKVPLQLPNTQDSPSVTIERQLPTTEYPKEITIGRSKNNDIVIDETKISNKHAVLIVSLDSITLKDLNSSNGTFLGEAKKEISESTVNSNDIIYFSSNRFKVSDLLKQAGVELPEVKTDLPEEKATSVPLVDYRPYLKIMIGCIVALVIVVGLSSLLPDLLTNPGKLSNSQETSTNTPNQTDGASSGNQAKELVEANTNDQQDQPVGMNKEDAIYALVVGNADQTEFFQAGTAFAIGPNTLLTAGSCKKRIDLVKKDYPLVFLLQKKLIPITNFELHPQYALSIQEEAIMQKKLDEAASRIEKSPEPEIAEDQLEAAYKNFLLATQESHHYDVAIITLPQRISSWLSLVQQKLPLLPQSRITLFGSSFDSQAPFISPESVVSVEEQKTRIQKLVSLNQLSTSPVLVTGKVDSGKESDHLETDWTGVPILDKENRVVAIYSRISPSDTIFSPTTGENFEAALVYPLLPFIRNKSEIK